MSEFSRLVDQFLFFVRENRIDIYNEFSLQHELGIFLRAKLPQYKVQFERNVSYFFNSTSTFTKRELDIAVFSHDRSNLVYAIELKYPRNGQYPEQMFKFCMDIAFAEELKAAGFSQAGLLILADSRPFYAGKGDGIYGYFRTGTPISGHIQQPTGSKETSVQINGTYRVSWLPLHDTTQYAFIEV